MEVGVEGEEEEGEGQPDKLVLPAWGEGPCLLTTVHTLSWSGGLCCMLCHWLCLPQCEYFGRQGLTLLFLLSLLVLSRGARAVELLFGTLVGLVRVWRLSDHARALQSRGVVWWPSARVGHRGRGNGRWRVVPVTEV